MRYKDIFVDNNLISNFNNKMSNEYKRFTKWLIDEGSLVISNLLRREYKNTDNKNNIHLIIDIQTRKGRLNIIENRKIREFKYKKHENKRLRSDDYKHIKIVLLSDRKLAISEDNNFRYDINNFPGYNARAEKSPSKINYRN
ncbi:MAG: hypothetical protein ACOC56_06525 [Atribacterota bacterium]